MSSSPFSQATLAFLAELEANNRRDWFAANKDRYLRHVAEPALEYIRRVGERLPSISPHFVAVPRRVGGSLMRPYRDTRFSADKTPYKTNIGIQFRHEAGKDVHAPGFYLHIAPDGCFLGAGIWRPDAAALGRLRDAIVAQPEGWVAVRDAPRFCARYALDGDSLKRMPRGYPKRHPLERDLRRKDFIAVAPLRAAQISAPGFVGASCSAFADAAPLMRWLCEALRLPY